MVLPAPPSISVLLWRRVRRRRRVRVDLRARRRDRRRVLRRALRRDFRRALRRERRGLLRRALRRERRGLLRRALRRDFLRPRRTDRRRPRRRDLRADRRLRRRGILLSLAGFRARRFLRRTTLTFRAFAFRLTRRDFLPPRFLAQYAAKPAGIRPLRLERLPTERRALPTLARPLMRIFLRRRPRAGLTYKIGMLLPSPR